MNQDIATSVTRNTTVMMGSQVITWASSFLLMLFLPRYLGSEEYGKLFLASSVSMIFQVLIDFGASYYIPKTIARDRDSTPSVFVNSFVLRVALGLLSLVLMVSFAYIAGYSSEVKYLLLIFGVSKLWEGGLTVMQKSFQGHEMMKYTALGNITERVVLSLAGVTALLLGAKAITVALLMIGSNLINVLVCSRFISRVINSFPKVDVARIKQIATESVPYFLWSLFSIVYYRIDAVMLSFMTPVAVVGWYGAAYRFFDVVMFFPSIFTAAIFPIFSKLWSSGDTSMAKTTQKSLDLMILFGIPISIGIFSFSGEIISLFFGTKDYLPSIGLLKIFSFGLLLVYINFILTSVIVASDRQRDWFKMAFLAMLFNPLLNYFLIPYFQHRAGNGGIGAALATLITEYFLLVRAMFMVPKSVFVNSKIAVITKGLLSGIAMFGSIWVAKQLGVVWIAQGVLGSLVYLATLFLLRTFEPPELRFMKSMLRPGRAKRDLAQQFGE